MKPTRFLIGLAALIAALAAVPFGYQAVTGQPIGGNTLLQTDAPSGSAPAVRANGTDANISINLVPKGTGTVQVNGVPVVAGSATSLTINPGPLNVTGTTNLTGPLFATPGTSGVLKGVGGIVLFNSSTQVATVGTGEETAYTFSIPGNTLSADNQWLQVTAWSTAGATGTNKQLRVKFGATTISDSTAANFSSGSLMWVECKLFRTGAATQRSFCVGSDGASGSLVNGASSNTWKNLTTPAETLSGAVTFLVTQQSATAANQTANGVILMWNPAGQ
jgi:hypothetical protein